MKYTVPSDPKDYALYGYYEGIANPERYAPIVVAAWPMVRFHRDNIGMIIQKQLERCYLPIRDLYIAIQADYIHIVLYTLQQFDQCRSHKYDDDSMINDEMYDMADNLIEYICKKPVTTITKTIARYDLIMQYMDEEYGNGCIYGNFAFYFPVASQLWDIANTVINLYNVVEAMLKYPPAMDVLSDICCSETFEYMESKEDFFAGLPQQLQLFIDKKINANEFMPTINEVCDILEGFEIDIVIRDDIHEYELDDILSDLIRYYSNIDKLKELGYIQD